MRTLITGKAKGLLLVVLTAISVGSVGCGDYAIFRIHVFSRTTDSVRDPIEKCQITITNPSGEKVLDSWTLQGISGAADERLKQGCDGNRTPSTIGDFSYSTSRSSGTLTFTVQGLDSSDKVILTGSSSGDVAPYPPEVYVDLEMKQP